MLFKLYDVVQTKRDYPHLSLKQKNIGTIVDVHNDGEAYTVEFIDDNGDTIEEALFECFFGDELILAGGKCSV